MIDYKLNLNDFKAILGRVNDGNVKMGEGGQLVKINYGGVITRKYHVGTTTEEENLSLRKAFLSAILNSREGSVLTEATIEQIRDQLGLPPGNPRDIALNRDKVCCQALTRHQISNIIKLVTNSDGGGQYATLIERDIQGLSDRGIYDEATATAIKDYIAHTPQLATKESLVKLLKKSLPKTFCGFPKDAILRMVRDNAIQLKELVFTRLYARTWEAKAEHGGNFSFGNLQFDLASTVAANVRDMMALFAQHREGMARFEQIVPNLPGTVADQNEVLNNPQLAPFNAALQNINALVDALFPEKTAVEGHPLKFEDIAWNRLSGMIKFALRKTLGTAMALHRNDVAAALASDAVKPFAALLKAPANVANMLRGDPALFADLQKHVFERITRRDFGTRDEAPGTVLKVFAKVLGPIAKNFDTDVQLQEAFKEARIDQSKYAELKNSLMPEGTLDVQDRQRCETIAKAKIRLEMSRLLHPETHAELDADGKEAIQQLAESFAAADLRQNESAEARKKLIEEFCQDRNENTFPAYLNGPEFAVYRSKATLMTELFTKEECEALGIPIAPTNRCAILFNGGEKLNGLSNYYKMTAENLGQEKVQEFKALAKKYEAIFDKAFEKISAHEIAARKLYLALQAQVHEEMIMEPGSHPMLEAMRDGLIPTNTSSESFQLFAPMFYAAKGDYEKGNMASAIASFSILTTCEKLSGLKAELETRIACMRISNPNEAKELEDALKLALNEVNGKHDGSNDAKNAALFQTYRDFLRDNHLNHIGYRGFGSTDIKTVFKTLAMCGIDITRMTTDVTRDEQGRLNPPDLDRALALMQLIERRGGNADGIREWFERVSGKPISQLSRETVTELFANGVKDPLDDVKENTTEGKVVRFLKGDFSLAQSGMTDRERISFIKTLQAFVRRQNGDLGAAASCDVTIGGVKVTLAIDTQFRKLTGTVTIGGKALPIPSPFEAGDLLVQTSNEVLSKMDAYLGDNESKAMLASILPGKEESRGNISRSRELYSRVIAKMTGQPIVNFASMKIDELRTMATGLIDGTVTAQNVKPPVSSSYNSQEAIELGQAMLENRVALEKIAWTGDIENTVPQNREGEKPSDETVRDLVADLVMNKNTWTFDVESNSASGVRMLKVLQGYAPEVRYLLAHDDALNALAPTVRETMRAILAEVGQLAADIGKIGTLESINPADEATKPKLATLEATLKNSMNQVMGNLQTMVSKLFVGQNGNPKEMWMTTSGELNGTGGLDVTTPHGKFIKAVLDRYFTDANEVDKCAMFSAFIRNVKPGDSAGKQAGELIKGAGPLLQKMLQGLPVETFPEETQAALQDTRSNLAPIPKEVVNARLLNMIANSNGYITKIDVKKSLGAASVGQAFLCKIYTKDRPFSGEDVVIKILRPNVETAARREYALIANIAASLNNGEDKVFEDRFAGILKEFDFTAEAGNIDRGSVYNHGTIGKIPSTDVESMGRYKAIQPTTGALVLQKVDGQPFSGYTRDIRRRMNDILAPMRTEYALGEDGPKTVTFEVKTDAKTYQETRLRLKILHQEVVERRQKLASLVQVWFQQAFEGGFIHGDMHSGNIMTHANVSTIIDFGNAMFLSESERKSILVALSACLFGEGTHNENPGDLIIQCVRNVFAKNKDTVALARFNDAADNANLRKEMRTVLTRGAKSDVVTRLLSCLTLMQKHGCPIPECFTEFTQSLSRLQAAMSDVDDLLSELAEHAEELKMSDELTQRFSNDPNDPLTKENSGFSFFRDVDAYLRDATGISSGYPKVDEELSTRIHPPVSESRRKARAEELLTQFKAANKPLLEENNGLNFVNLVLGKYNNLITAQISKTNASTIVYLIDHRNGGFSLALKKHQELIANNAAPEELAQSRDNLHRELINAVMRYVGDFNSSDSNIRDHEQKTLSFEECGYNALQTVLNFYLTGETDTQLVASAGKLFGSVFDAGTTLAFGGRLGKNIQGYGAKSEETTERVAQIQTLASDVTKPDSFVSRRSRRLLGKLAKNFLMPPEGITADNLQTVVRVNLDEIVKTLGKNTLTDPELKYFTDLVEAQNWKPSLPLFGSASYTSPFGALNKDDDGATAFFNALKTEMTLRTQKSDA